MAVSFRRLGKSPHSRENCESHGSVHVALRVRALTDLDFYRERIKFERGFTYKSKIFDSFSRFSERLMVLGMSNSHNGQMVRSSNLCTTRKSD